MEPRLKAVSFFAAKNYGPVAGKYHIRREFAVAVRNAEEPDPSFRCKTKTLFVLSIANLSKNVNWR